jgi:hypothetical protein
MEQSTLQALHVMAKPTGALCYFIVRIVSVSKRKGCIPPASFSHEVHAIP